MALNKAKVITITSVKGGSGKTVTTLNIAGVLSTLKKKTIILDLDLYFGSIAASLNLPGDADIYTLNEDMMNNRFKNIQDYIRKYNEFIDVLAAPIDPRSVSKISSKFIDILLSRLELQYDVILIDTNHVVDATNLIAFDHSDQILYLITNDLMDIKNMKTMITIYKDMEKDNFKIILNEPLNKNSEYKTYDIETILDSKINYIIPKKFYIHNIEKYILNGQIFILEKKFFNSNGGHTIRNIIKNIIKE